MLHDGADGPCDATPVRHVTSWFCGGGGIMRAATRTLHRFVLERWRCMYMTCWQVRCKCGCMCGTGTNVITRASHALSHLKAVSHKLRNHDVASHKRPAVMFSGCIPTIARLETWWDAVMASVAPPPSSWRRGALLDACGARCECRTQRHGACRSPTCPIVSRSSVHGPSTPAIVHASPHLLPVDVAAGARACVPAGSRHTRFFGLRRHEGHARAA
jgi:hypothetical protein